MAVKNVRQLISQAYKLIGKTSEHQDLTSVQIKDGLDSLNDRLDHFGSIAPYIAYRKSLTFPLIVGKETYELSNETSADVSTNNLIGIDLLTLQSGNMSYPVEIIEDAYYYNKTRDVTSSGRPNYVFLQNDTLKSFLTFFKKPGETYTCFLKGKFVLTNITINSNLNELPQFYNEFFKYDLARTLKDSYAGNSWDGSKEKKYSELYDDIFGSNETTLTIESGVALLPGDNNLGDSLGIILWVKMLILT